MPQRNIGWRKLSRWIWTLSGIAVFIGIWTAASFEIGNAVLLPAPTAVVSGFVSLLQDGTLMADVVASLKRVLGGFAIASAAAIPLALIMAFSRPVELLLSPIITFLRPDSADRVDSDCNPLVRHRRSAKLFHYCDRGLLPDLS